MVAPASHQTNAHLLLKKPWLQHTEELDDRGFFTSIGPVLARKVTKLSDALLMAQPALAVLADASVQFRPSDNHDTRHVTQVQGLK